MIEPLYDLERIRLRKPVLDDAPLMFGRWTADARVTKYLVWKPHLQLDDTKAYVQRVQDFWEKGEEFTWLICTKADDKPIGSISFRQEGFGGGIGYALAGPHWGKGIATAAAKHVLDVGFSQTEIYRMGGYCDVDNLASANVLGKLGMTNEGVLRSWLIHPAISRMPRDCYSFSILRSEFLAKPVERAAR